MLYKISKYSGPGLLTLLFCVSVFFFIDKITTLSIRRAAPPTESEAVKPIPFLASADHLDALAAQYLDRTPPHLDLALDATHQSIAINPRIISNWNRLAYIDVARDGLISQDGIDALNQSFFLSPYGDPDVMQWRLEVINAYWYHLPQDIREAGLRQITALYNYSERTKGWLRRFRRDARPHITERINSVFGYGNQAS
ncbi:hypothetical protein [Ponticaulis sp.]|uniref:hypothetical protein n=1 Tax=Ponticaulis sp. TaxID=2020902 RepID=UPI000B65D846|nr:hypothetical protein [Ponticaulis sp.]MAI91865.1 hypothetical protein [Ponticaulis sp.]OUX96548.1 MAG: hypothetical protein CBB65_15655 [Hyphomonadaceae bacterium TMED5]|tara:strand:- start:19923 stop:20516 length:594 start_codon:yes stop_codon:yes gene_type:complete